MLPVIACMRGDTVAALKGIALAKRCQATGGDKPGELLATATPPGDGVGFTAGSLPPLPAPKYKIFTIPSKLETGSGGAGASAGSSVEFVPPFGSSPSTTGPDVTSHLAPSPPRADAISTGLLDIPYFPLFGIPAGVDRASSCARTRVYIRALPSGSAAGGSGARAGGSSAWKDSPAGIAAATNVYCAIVWVWRCRFGRLLYRWVPWQA